MDEFVPTLMCRYCQPLPWVEACFLSLIGLILHCNSVWGLPKEKKKREKRREKKGERPTEGFIARSVFWPVGVYAPTQISKRARCYGCPFLLEFVLFACLVRYLGVYSLSTLQYVRTVCLCVITRARTYENLITFKRNKSTYIDREVDRHIGRQID